VQQRTSLQHDDVEAEIVLASVARSAILCLIMIRDRRRRSSRARARPVQLSLARTGGWGGKRRGAGRKPKGKIAGVSHAGRARFHRRFPLLVTVKVLPHVYNLRARRCATIVEEAIGESERDDFRVVHYSIQGNHVHLLVEAVGREALSRGMQGMSVRMARGLNRVMQRSGTVFADRYDSQVLETPRRVRNALHYVLCNARRHGIVDGRVRRDWVDPCSSAIAFDGWSTHVWCDRRGPPPVAPPHTWLLARGWRKGGSRLAADHVPGPRA
jgi:hypothetical protein